MLLPALDYLNFLGLADEATFLVKSEAPGLDCFTHTLSGSFAEHEDFLTEANSAGAGVFVQVLGGRRQGAKGVKHADWLFVDLDDHEELPALPFEASMVVRTARGFHVYWAIERMTDFGLWDAVQLALCVSVRGDINAIDRARMLRVAGFMHCKGFPVEVEIVQRGPAYYKLEAVAKALNVAYETREDKREKQYVRGQLSAMEPTMPELFKLCRERLGYWRTQLSRCEVGTRYLTVRRAAMELGRYAHLGLGWELSYGTIMKCVRDRSWPDADLQPHVLRKVVIDSMLWGYHKLGCPSLPAAQLHKFNRIHARQYVLGQLASISDELPDRINLREADGLEAVLPDAREAFESPRQFSYDVGRALVRLGFERKRWGSGVFYVRVSRRAAG